MTGSEPVGADLTACDREPIHIPGSIQPHGVLLALDPADLRVQQASRNTEALLGVPVEKVLGRRLGELLDPEGAHGLAAAAAAIGAEPENARVPVYLRTIRAPESGGVFSVVAHRYDAPLIVELEPTEARETSSFHQLYPVVIHLPDLLRSTSTLEESAPIAAEEIRRLTHFDRVLIYKFEKDWNGQVVAESKVDELVPYLGLWFPASDIPAPARKLYETNRLRVIVDSGAEPVPLVPELNPLTKKPLDMSHAVLRSVSPVHIEYLKNMNIVTGLSISLLGSDGRLWGLISCHHRTRRAISVEMRMACEIMARILGSQVEKVDINERALVFEHELVVRSISARFVEFLTKEEDFIEGLRSRPEELLSFAAAEGAAVVHGTRCTMLGRCPAEKDVWTIVEWLHQNGPSTVFTTDRSVAVFPNGEALLAAACGVMAIRISKSYNSYVLWFRPEIVRALHWGGDPRKLEAEAGASGRLHPRKSFEVWQETIRGSSKSWADVEVEAAGMLRDAITAVASPKAEEFV